MSQNEAKPVQPTAARLLFILIRASASVGTYIERTFGQRGFCFTDFMVLEALLHKGPLPISALGEKVALASASMTAAIDRLEERRLLHRGLSSEDRRVRMITLTAKGRKFIENVFAQHLEDMETIAKEIPDEERKALYAALKKIGLAAKAAMPALGGSAQKAAAP